MAPWLPPAQPLMDCSPHTQSHPEVGWWSESNEEVVGGSTLFRGYRQAGHKNRWPAPQDSVSQIEKLSNECRNSRDRRARLSKVGLKPRAGRSETSETGCANGQSPDTL